MRKALETPKQLLSGDKKRKQFARWVEPLSDKIEKWKRKFEFWHQNRVILSHFLLMQLSSFMFHLFHLPFFRLLQEVFGLNEAHCKSEPYELAILDGKCISSAFHSFSGKNCFTRRGTSFGTACVMRTSGNVHSRFFSLLFTLFVTLDITAVNGINISDKYRIYYAKMSARLNFLLFFFSCSSQIISTFSTNGNNLAD